MLALAIQNNHTDFFRRCLTNWSAEEIATEAERPIPGPADIASIETAIVYDRFIMAIHLLLHVNGASLFRGKPENILPLIQNQLKDGLTAQLISFYLQKPRQHNPNLEIFHTFLYAALRESRIQAALILLEQLRPHSPSYSSTFRDALVPQLLQFARFHKQ